MLAKVYSSWSGWSGGSGGGGGGSKLPCIQASPLALIRIPARMNLISLARRPLLLRQPLKAGARIVTPVGNLDGAESESLPPNVLFLV